MEIIKLEVFKENHKLASFPPTFESYSHIYFKQSEGFNCYAYAMQFQIPVERGKGFYRPGFLSGMTPKGGYTNNTVIPAFLGDCEYLDLKAEETTIDAPLMKNAYKIIAFHNECSFNTFHFVRQNQDGKWSEMIAWGEEPEAGTRLNEEYYREEGFSNKVFYLSRK